MGRGTFCNHKCHKVKVNVERYGTQVSIYNVFPQYDAGQLGVGGGRNYSDAKVDKSLLQLTSQ